MSRMTISECMVAISSTVNQEAALPSGTEYTLWLQYINRSVAEWAQANDWEALRKYFYPNVTGASLASISLPSDFSKLAANPKVYDGTITEGTDYPEVLPEQEGLYDKVNDKYLQVIGGPDIGYSLLINPAPASGASIVIQYYSAAISFASPAEVVPLSDPQFIVDRTIAYIFEARSDARFQLMEVKARDRLLQMIENANLSKYNSQAGSNPVLTENQKETSEWGGTDYADYRN